MNIYVLYAITLVLAFAVTAALGKVLIPFLHKLKFGQNIIEDFGPTWHAKKQGTPTMGGFMFIIGIIFTSVIAILLGKATGLDVFAHEFDITRNNEIIKLCGCAFLALSFSAVGFTDDFIKVGKKRNLGLTEVQKTVPEVIVIAVFLACMAISGNAQMFIPGMGKVVFDSVIKQIMYYVFGAVVIYATVNAANFTDGLDGLCASVTIPVGVAFAVMAGMYKLTSISLVACALAGALAGYLIWNHYPAKVMMGDTGSNFIGGLVVAFAYAIDCPLILLPVCIIYVMEGASDIIQIASVVLLHRKVFKMAPIHHHFEMSGWSEKKIVNTYTLISWIGCGFGVLVFGYLLGM